MDYAIQHEFQTENLSNIVQRNHLLIARAHSRRPDFTRSHQHPSLYYSCLQSFQSARTKKEKKKPYILEGTNYKSDLAKLYRRDEKISIKNIKRVLTVLQVRHLLASNYLFSLFFEASISSDVFLRRTLY